MKHRESPSARVPRPEDRRRRVRVPGRSTLWSPGSAAFVLIGRNRAAACQQAEAGHDFVEQEAERKTTTERTGEIHVLTTELHRRVVGGR